MSASVKSFYQGFAIAIGSLAREHGEPAKAVDIMHCNGVTLAQLKQAGVAKFDLDAIEKEWNMMEPRKQAAQSKGNGGEK